MKYKSKNQIEKEFNDDFELSGGRYFGSKWTYTEDMNPRVLDFIEQIRKQDREAIVEMIEEMKFPEYTMIGEAYNGTLNNIINKIKEL
jgi:hypothetical protein